MPARERGRVLAVFHDMMDGKAELVEFYENSIVTGLDEERIIAWHNALLTDETGKRVGTLSSGTDVTEQRHAQLALKRAHDELEHRVQQRTVELTDANSRLSSEIRERRKAEEQLQVIYDGMVDGLLIARISTKRFVRANSSICRMLGYSDKELTGMSVIDIHPPADVPRVLDIFENLVDQPSIVADNLSILRNNGSIFFADVTASHIVYGGERCLSAFFVTFPKGRKVARNYNVSTDPCANCWTLTIASGN